MANPFLTRVVDVDEDRKCALLWAIELALDDQEHYLATGDPKLDYGDEWPDAAATKIEMLEHVAGFCRDLGAEQMATDCEKLIAALEDSNA